MKKVLISFIIVIMAICMNVETYAVNETTPNIELNLMKNTTISEGTKEITLKLSLGEFTEIQEGALISFKGIIKYSEDIFSNISVTGLNGYTATYAESTKRIVLDPKEGKANTEVAKITLTLKEGVEPCTTNVSFQLEEFTDGENDFTLSTKAVTITIEKKSEQAPTETPEQNPGTEILDGTQETEAPETSGKITSTKEDSTTAKTNLPKTGSKTIVGIVTIVLAIGIVCLIRYKKIEIK